MFSPIHGPFLSSRTVFWRFLCTVKRQRILVRAHSSEWTFWQLISIRLGYLSRKTIGQLVPIGNVQVTEHQNSTTNFAWPLSSLRCRTQDDKKFPRYWSHFNVFCAELLLIHLTTHAKSPQELSCALSHLKTAQVLKQTQKMYLHDLNLLQFPPSTSENLVEKLLLHVKNKKPTNKTNKTTPSWK